MRGVTAALTRTPPVTRRRVLAAAGAVVTALALAAAPPATAAPDLACGSVVTTDTTLTEHLSCLTLGVELAPGVTLDLAGYTIFSDEAHALLGPESGTATVTGGHLRGGEYAVTAVGRAGHLVLTDVTARGGDLVAVIDGPRLTVDRSVVEGGEVGIRCDTCLIRSSQVHATERAVSGGATIERSTIFGSRYGVDGRTVVRDSVVREGDIGIAGNPVIIRTRFEGVGVGVEAEERAVVVGSTFTRNGVGVSVQPGATAELSGTLLVGNGYGLRAPESPVVLRRTTAVANSQVDIDAPYARIDAWHVGTPPVPVPATAAPEPAHPLCGAHLTTSTTLEADLTCAQGLTLADGVTLDLAGHALRGPGTGTGVGLEGTGVVRGGTVSGWGVGVGVWSSFWGTPAGDRTLVGTTLSDNGVGVLTQAGRLRAEQVTWRRNATGLRCDSSCIVRDGVLTDHAGAAIDVTGDVDVSGTTSRGNGAGVLLTSTAARSRVVDSTFVDGAHEGVAVEGSAVTVTRDVLRRNGTGVVVTGGLDPALPAPPDVLLTALVADRNGDGVLAEPAGVRLRAVVATRNDGYGIHAPAGTDLGGNLGVGNGRSPQVRIGE